MPGCVTLSTRPGETQLGGPALTAGEPNGRGALTQANAALAEVKRDRPPQGSGDARAAKTNLKRPGPAPTQRRRGADLVASAKLARR